MTDPEPEAPDFDANSILSHGERQVARLLHEDPDASAEEIAEARGVDADAVEKSIDRIEEKTVRALATLDQSPFTGAVTDEDPAAAERVAAVLGREDGDGDAD